MEELSKTAQEDVPKRSQESLPSKILLEQAQCSQTQPPFQNYPKKQSVNERHISEDEAPREASEEDKAHVESRRHTGSRGDSC